MVCQRLDVEADGLLAGKGVQVAAIESISRAMCWAERERVPLKSMCSTKWEMPLVSAGSQREPDLIHTPMAPNAVFHALGQ